MPVICKISLDAEEYRQKLAQVIAETKQAQAALSDQLASRSTDEGGSGLLATAKRSEDGSDKSFAVTADTSDAVAALTSLPAVADQSFAVTADIGAAQAALTSLPGVTDQSFAVTADVGAAQAALTSLPAVADQSFAVTADTSDAVAALTSLPGVADQSFAVTADVGAAQAALTTLPGVADQSFAVTADVSAAQSSLLKVTGDTEKLNKTVAKVPVKGFAAEFKNGLSAIREELNKTTGGAGKFLETFLAGGGGIGIIMAGVGAAITMIGTAYNTLRQRLQENAEQFSRNSASIRETAEANEAVRQKTDGYLSKLQELSSAEKLSNSQKAEAAKLIGDLTKSYGDLGVKIDEVTGKLTGVDAAVVKKLQQDKSKRTAEIEAELKQIQNEIKQQQEIRDTAGIPIWFGGNTRVGGEEETKAAGQKIEELTKRAAELNKKRVEIKRSDPVEEFRKKQKAEVEDLKKQLTEQRKITSDHLATAKQSEDMSDPSGKIAHLQKQRDRHQQETLDPLQKKIDHAEWRVLSTKGDDQVGAEKQLLQLKIAQQQELQKAYALEKQIKEVKDQQAQAAENLKKNLKTQSFDLYGQAMTQAGFGKEFAQQKALRDAREVKGSDLSDSEKKSVLKLAELSFGLSQRREASFGDLSVKTNALTARGGFQGGAVVPDTDRYNREIAQTSRTLLVTLQRIETLCKDMGTF